MYGSLLPSVRGFLESARCPPTSGIKVSKECTLPRNDRICFCEQQLIHSQGIILFNMIRLILAYTMYIL